MRSNNSFSPDSQLNNPPLIPTPQAARFAEWMSTIFLLTVLMNALDCPSWRELVWSTALQFAAVGFGFSASVACQLWGPLHDGGCPWRVPPESSSDSSSDSGSEGHWRHRGVAGPDDGTWWAPAALARSSPAFKAQLVALVLAVAPNVPGFINAATNTAGTDNAYFPPVFDTIYSYAWFVGILLAVAIYAALGWKAVKPAPFEQYEHP